MLAARYSFLAGQRYGIPIAGTMAHAYVQAHDCEEEAFAAFVHSCRDGSTLLVDTYDVPRALERVMALVRRLRDDGTGHVGAVRIDSGDLDEYRIAALLAQGALVDSFGVGTRMATSADAPFLDCAYKLAEYDGRGRRKRSAGKETYPGRKQVFRRADDAGSFVEDTVGLETEYVRGRPLLQPVMLGGRRCCPDWPLAHLRQELRSQLASLPPGFTAFEQAAPPSVRISPGLTQLTTMVDFQFG